MSNRIDQHLNEVIEYDDSTILYFREKYFLSAVANDHMICTRKQLAVILEKIKSDDVLCSSIIEYDNKSQCEISIGALQASDQVRSLYAGMYNGIREKISDSCIDDSERLLSVLLAHIGYYIQD